MVLPFLKYENAIINIYMYFFFFFVPRTLPILGRNVWEIHLYAALSLVVSIQQLYNYLVFISYLIF